MPDTPLRVDVFSFQWLQGREWAIVVASCRDDALRMLAKSAEWPNDWRGIRCKCLHLDVDDEPCVVAAGEYSELKGKNK